MGIAGGRRTFLDIADIEHGLGGQQLRGLEHPQLLLVLDLHQPRGLAFAQQLQRLTQHLGHQLGFLVALRGLLLRGRHPLFEAFKVRQHQLGLDRVGIRNRIDAVVDVLDIVIFETAQHVDDGVDLADIAEELVAKAFALAGPAHEAGDVDEGQLGRDDLLATRNRRQLVKPGIGHADLPDVGLDRAEGIVRRLRRLGLGQRVEQGGLADIGQPDDTTFETHETLRARRVAAMRGPLYGWAARRKRNRAQAGARADMGERRRRRSITPPMASVNSATIPGSGTSVAWPAPCWLPPSKPSSL